MTWKYTIQCCLNGFLCRWMLSLFHCFSHNSEQFIRTDTKLCVGRFAWQPWCWCWSKGKKILKHYCYDFDEVKRWPYFFKHCQICSWNFNCVVPFFMVAAVKYDYAKSSRQCQINASRVDFLWNVNQVQNKLKDAFPQGGQVTLLQVRNSFH